MRSHHLLGLIITAATLLSASSAFADTCPDMFYHERDDIFHKSPRKRLTTNLVSEGRTCLRFTRPSIHNAAPLCPPGRRLEEARVLHDSPKKRLLNDSNTLNLKGKRTTCIQVSKPGQTNRGDRA